MSAILYEKKECCYGCGACEAICPVDAIKMILDEDGFYYPDIQGTCIECGMCLKVCIFKKGEASGY